MKKLISLLLAATLVFSLVACSSKSTSTKTDSDKTESAESTESTENTAKKENLKLILIVNGNLGDLGFFDSANAGIERLRKEYNVEAQVIETGADESKWEPAIADAAEEDVDIIVAVSPSMVEPVQKLAPLYPEKIFILIDNAVDFESADLSNVYCATFKQNEGSFLAGALAAYLSADSNKLIGFLGGMDIPPINDFLVGYIEGAQYVDPLTKVIAVYAGDYYDPAKGKELGIVLSNNGADVIFPAAGPTGLGTIEAAKEEGKYIIGVDSDQSAGYAANGDSETSKIIASSMIKNVGNTIFRAVELYMDDKLALGSTESLGIPEGGVGLAKNDVYKSLLSEDILTKMEEIEAKVISGEIKVSTAIGMSTEDLNKIRNSVAPE